MNIEEKRKIEEMYEKGLVEISSIIEPLIENFKIDRCSIDIQQCQLVIDYLIRDRDFDENYIQQLEEELEKEKEKNKELKWKPIKDYDRKKYDWVLVKYFDGDYECVPEVAERRNDDKWYTSERQIPFEVKYFFDMQQILEEE